MDTEAKAVGFDRRQLILASQPPSLSGINEFEDSDDGVGQSSGAEDEGIDDSDAEGVERKHQRGHRISVKSMKATIFDGDVGDRRGR
jgi:hypothetical protein